MAVTKLIEGLAENKPLVHDHIAFRTLGVRRGSAFAALQRLQCRNHGAMIQSSALIVWQVGRYGCDSLARVFTDNHYVQRDALAFPTKKAGGMQGLPEDLAPLPLRIYYAQLYLSSVGTNFNLNHMCCRRMHCGIRHR